MQGWPTLTNLAPCGGRTNFLDPRKLHVALHHHPRELTEPHLRPPAEFAANLRGIVLEVVDVRRPVVARVLLHEVFLVEISLADNFRGGPTLYQVDACAIF